MIDPTPKVSNYYGKPTPTTLLKVQDTLQAISVAIAGSSLATANPILGAVGLALFVASKIVNFWAEI
jgi:hypothetical protein